MTQRFRAALQAAILLAALASIGLTITAVDLQAPVTRVLGLVFAAWVAGPYLLLLHAATRREADALHGRLLLAAALAIAAFGLGVYYDAMQVHPDLRSAFVFLVVPPVQLLAAGLAVFLLHRRLSRRAAATRSGGN